MRAVRLALVFFFLAFAPHASAGEKIKEWFKSIVH